jgi:hypothetical protein
MRSLVAILATTAFGFSLAAGASVGETAGPTGPAVITNPAVPNAGDLYRRMLAINAKLRSYTASVTLDIKMTSFPYLSPELTGTAYYKQPDKRAVVFDTVPVLAEQAKKVYPKVEEPVDWPKVYTITPISDESGLTTFRLIPKKNGRVEHLDVKIDDANATVGGYTWTYKDGGYVTFEQTFKTIEGNYLPEKLSGRVELPSYKANVTSALSNYKLNVAIADSVFAEK